jgi:hypothetical protein
MHLGVKNYSLKVCIITLVCFLALTNVYAQRHAANGAQKVINNDKEKKQIIKAEQIKQKIIAIEKLDISDAEKSKLIKELRASVGIKDPSDNHTITFQPRYFSTAILEKWKNIVINKNINAMDNIVIVNEGYAIDFNNYFDRDLYKQLDKLIEDNPVSENIAFKYILPNLYYLKSINKEMKTSELVEMVKLYFSSKPGLYYLLPTNVANALNNNDALEKILLSQKSN